MDSNRDVALQVKVLAEIKLTEKDYAGAKKLALKAQNLFPSLEEINQMITILDIYLASEAKVNGEKDWYAVLHVNPSTDEATLKNHYKKLAHMLHPDKNKSAGAEGAFQIVSQAWSILSDKNQKMLYDQKIFEKGSHITSQPSKNTNKNDRYQFSNNAATKKKIQSSKPFKPPSHQPFQTFWTSCTGCRMQYEFHIMYLNKSLLCPKCKQPFLATELPAPPSGLSNPLQWPSKQHNKPKSKSVNKKPSTLTGKATSGIHHGLNTESFTNQSMQCPSFSSAGATIGANGLSISTLLSSNTVHHAYKAKRQREEVQKTVKKEEALRRKLLRRTFVGNHNAQIDADKHATSMDTGDVPRNNSIVDQAASNMGCNRNTILDGEYLKSRSNSRSINFNKACTQAEVKAILIEKAKDRILKKIRELCLSDTTMSKDNDRMVKQKYKDVKATKEVDRKNVKYKVPGNSTDVQIIDCAGSNISDVPDRKLCINDGSDDSFKQVNHHLSIDVPDPDFHDFDSDRTEKAFRADQVWATYDDDDGMPRYYALIQKVLSVKPFKACISFLTSKSNVEFGSLGWVSRGFPKTCGDFRVGRYVVANKINIFSHMVKWEKGFRGVIKVLPRKGDIWALYRNWHPNWCELTPDDVIHKYEMVEVLEDYSDNQGITVVPLVKVAGFKTVFLKHMDPNENRKIPKEEMFRFSHQVPSYLLTGMEAHNAPKDCLELDPAATSLELLQVLTETREESLMNDAESESFDRGFRYPVSDLISANT